MSFNKKAFARYMVYDRCFRNQNTQYSVSDLIKECNAALKKIYNSPGVSRRQVYYDIEFMKSSEGFSAPIVCSINENGKRFYTYSDSRYSIFSFLCGEELISITEFRYLWDVIGILTGPEFLDCLITERNYRKISMTDYLKRMDSINGMLAGYAELRKLYKVIDSIIQKKSIRVIHKGIKTDVFPLQIIRNKNHYEVFCCDVLNSSETVTFDLEYVVI